MQWRYRIIPLPEVYWCVDTLPIWMKYRNLACMLSQSLWPPRTVPTRQSMGLFRQEYWSGLLFPSPGNFPNPGIKPASPVAPALAGTFFTTVPLGKPSVQFSRSVVSNFLRPHESQHARPPCPSPTPEVQSDSRPLSPWCHPAISSSVVPFSCCPQSLPASESFPMS